VHLELVGGTERLDLNSDGEGHWVDSAGGAILDLDGCIDVDISTTPFTNTLPIRRLRLQSGQSADLPMVYIFVPTFQISRTMQRYTCLESGPEGSSYRFEDIESGYNVVLPVDASGVVLDYPELFGRVWAIEYRTMRKR
jgi:hypothetical protein